MNNDCSDGWGNAKRAPVAPPLGHAFGFAPATHHLVPYSSHFRLSGTRRLTFKPPFGPFGFPRQSCYRGRIEVLSLSRPIRLIFMSVSMPSTPAEKPLRRSSHAASIAAGPPPKASLWTGLLAAAVIALASIAAFQNSFTGVMVADDNPWILDNPSIRQLSPLGGVMFPPRRGSGRRTPARLALAGDQLRLGGVQVWGYHDVNLAIHILAALVLFGVIRRTLLLPRMRDRFGSAATALALARSRSFGPSIHCRRRP